jgi:hypothetical protein
MSLSNIMKMTPIYMNIVSNIEKNLKESSSNKNKNILNNENSQESKIGFLIALGFSMVSNLFNIPLSTHLPQEGETFQAHWEDGTTITWEAIKFKNSSNGRQSINIISRIGVAGLTEHGSAVFNFRSSEQMANVRNFQFLSEFQTE